MLASAVLLTAVLPTTSFAAATPASTLVKGSTSATLVLRSADASGLATTRTLSRPARLSRLTSLLPSIAARASVVASAEALGLTVDKTTPWSVVVHGKASAIAKVARSGHASGRLVSTSPSLLPGVSSVMLGGGQRLNWQPAGTQQVHYGADFHAAYTASSASPPIGQSRPVIATLQFSGWNAQELGVEATNLSLPTPPATLYTSVSIDGASTTQDDGTGGSGEVALDQESIYAVDPYADQRVYFAGQTPQDEMDAYYTIASDAMSARGIMALSISWDVCEHDSNNAVLDAPTVAGLHAAIAAVVAAGVTVFAASGDTGAKCFDGGIGVSFPASDPLVVAVGGTTLHTPGPVETGWGATTTSSNANPAGFAGSGGGVSRIFPEPAYQTTVAPGAAGREVPDIAADADPQTGFPIYHDDGLTGDGHGPGTYLVGGTSLSAPMSTALMVSELGSRGVTTGGVGDIHQILYSAVAGSFRDITSGSNGGYQAGVGYDMVTGLGAPNWQVLVSQMIVSPTVSVPAVSPSRIITPAVVVPGGQTIQRWATGYGTPPACGNSAGKPTTLTAVTVPADGHYTIWVEAYTSYQTCLIASAATTVDTTGPVAVLTAAATNATGTKVKYGWVLTDVPAGVASVSVTVLRNGVPVWSTASAATGTVVLPGKPGSIYRLVVVGKDTLGNTSTTARNVSVAFDDRSFHLTGKWSRIHSKSAYGGVVATAALKGAVARITAYGSTFTLMTRTCATCGVLGIYVDGKHLRDISLYSKVTKPSVVVKLTTVAVLKAHKIMLVVRGTKPPHSTGSSVFVDGLLAT